MEKRSDDNQTVHLKVHVFVIPEKLPECIFGYFTEATMHAITNKINVVEFTQCVPTSESRFIQCMDVAFVNMNMPKQGIKLCAPCIHIFACHNTQNCLYVAFEYIHAVANYMHCILTCWQLQPTHTCMLHTCLYTSYPYKL